MTNQKRWMTVLMITLIVLMPIAYSQECDIIDTSIEDSVEEYDNNLLATAEGEQLPTKEKADLVSKQNTQLIKKSVEQLIDAYKEYKYTLNSWNRGERVDLEQAREEFIETNERLGLKGVSQDSNPFLENPTEYLSAHTEKQTNLEDLTTQIEQIQKNKGSAFVIIDGKPGTGKLAIADQLANNIENSVALHLDDTDDLWTAIQQARKENKVVILEGSFVASHIEILKSDYDFSAEKPKGTKELENINPDLITYVEVKDEKARQDSVLKRGKESDRNKEEVELLNEFNHLEEYFYILDLSTREESDFIIDNTQPIQSYVEDTPSEEIIQLLEQGKTEEIVAMGRSVVPVLIEIMREEFFYGYSAYINDILAKMGKDAEEAIPILITYLKIGDMTLRESASDALASIGEPAVPALIETLENAKTLTKISIIEALSKIGPAAKEAVPALIEALKDSDSSIQREAASALKEIRDPSAVPVLIEVLKYEDADVKRHTINVLGNIKDASAVPALIEALKDENLFVKRATATALGNIKDASAVPALIEALQDKDRGVRINAATALQKIGDPSAVPALIEALKDEESIVRLIAMSALGNMGPNAKDAVPALIEAFRYADPNSIVFTLKNIGAEYTIPALIISSKDLDPEIREGSIQALGEIGDPSAVPVLIEILEDVDLSIRKKAIVALRNIGPDAKEAMPILIKILKDQNKALSERKNAAIALGKIGIITDELIIVFIEALEDQDINPEINEAIRDIGPGNIVISLLEMIDNAEYSQFKDQFLQFIGNNVKSVAGRKDASTQLEKILSFQESLSKKDVKEAVFYKSILDGQELTNDDLGNYGLSLEKDFPYTLRLQEILGETGRGKKLLVVHNIQDGQGDELIRMVPFIQALIDKFPDLDITIYTDRQYLYEGSPNIHIKDLSSFELEKNHDFDMIINHFEDNIGYDWSHEFAISNADQPSIFIRTDKQNDDFEIRQLKIDGLDDLEIKKGDSVYDPVTQLSIELGLPIRFGTNQPKEINLILGKGSESAQDWWNNNILEQNKENRPVIFFNGFGGESEFKGYDIAKDNMANDIAELIKAGNFIILFPNDQEWGTYEKAYIVRTQVAERLEMSKEELDQYLIIPPGPKGTEETPNAGSLIKHWVAMSDHIVTVEGGMMHLAYNLGKPFTLVLKGGAGPAKWYTPIRSEDQAVVGIRGTSEDIRREVSTGRKIKEPILSTEAGFAQTEILAGVTVGTALGLAAAAYLGPFALLALPIYGLFKFTQGLSYLANSPSDGRISIETQYEIPEGSSLEYIRVYDHKTGEWYEVGADLLDIDEFTTTQDLRDQALEYIRQTKIRATHKSIQNAYNLIDQSYQLDFDLMQETGDYTDLYNLFESLATLYGAEISSEGQITYLESSPIDSLNSQAINDKIRDILTIYENNINLIFNVEDEARINMMNAVAEIQSLETSMIDIFEQNPKLPSEEIQKILSYSPEEAYQRGYLFRGVTNEDYYRLQNNRNIQSIDPESQTTLREHIIQGEKLKQTPFISFTADAEIARDFGEKIIIVRRDQLQGNLLDDKQIESKVKGDTEAMSLVRKNNEYILEPTKNNPTEIPSTSIVN